MAVAGLSLRKLHHQHRTMDVADAERQTGSSLDLADTVMGLVEGEHQQGQKMDHTEASRPLVVFW
jgi:hypothetical protein